MAPSLPTSFSRRFFFDLKCAQSFVLLLWRIAKEATRLWQQIFYPNTSPLFPGMSDSVSGRPAESRPPSERSPLLQVKLPESEVIVYGTRSQTSQASDADSHSSSGRTDDTSRQDEEANIDSGSHAVAASQVSQTPLSTKAILWIVLPMVLGMVAEPRS